MPSNTNTVVTTRGFGSRLMSSISGVFIGLILFLLSFGLLYWNEGREGLYPTASSTTEISSEQLNPELNNQGVSVSGTLTSSELLGDNYLVEGEYAAVSRNVEMYAWVEEANTKTTTNVGGSETDTTTYTYKQDWVSNVSDSSKFNTPTGHTNPTKALESKTFTLTNALVGIYEVNLKEVDLDGFEDLTLTETNFISTNLTAGKPSLVDSEYIFLEKAEVGVLESTYTNPKVGDMRVSYQVINLNQDVTVFGKLSGNTIKSFTSSDGQELYRMFMGSREAALNTIKTEDSTTTWILRGVGFLMMWIGLSSLFAPLTTLASIIPFLGSLSKSVINGITFVVSVILTILTILISMLLHSVVALVIVGAITLLIFIGGFVFLKSKKKANA